MKAIVYRLFGSPDVLELAEVDRPTAGVVEAVGTSVTRFRPATRSTGW